MPFELAPAVVVALALIVWRATHRPRPKVSGPLPDIGEAPATADRVFVWRYNEDGLTRYLDEVPGRPADREAEWASAGGALDQLRDLLLAC